MERKEPVFGVIAGVLATVTLLATLRPGAWLWYPTMGMVISTLVVVIDVVLDNEQPMPFGVLCGNIVLWPTFVCVCAELWVRKAYGPKGP